MPDEAEENDVASPIPLTSDSQLDEFRSRILGTAADSEMLVDTAVETVGWDGAQLEEVGRAAYDALKEQYGSRWASVRDELASSSWRRPNGQVVRNIPGRYDTELVDTAEAIVGQGLTDTVQRKQVRSGFWARFDDDRPTS